MITKPESFLKFHIIQNVFTSSHLKIHQHMLKSEKEEASIVSSATDSHLFISLL